MSDSNRMFALLSRLCQSPVSWYTSGPAQKFILRQIRAIDNSYEELFATKFDPSEAGEKTVSKIDMDVCLLMLYGHILFTSTSYTYAISKCLLGLDRIPLLIALFRLFSSSQITRP